MADRMWRRLRRNAGSVALILVKETLRVKNLLGLVAVGAALVAGAGAVGAATGGNLLGAGWLAAMTGGALYGGLKSFLGKPWRGAAVLVVAAVLVGGSAQAVGVFDDTETTDETVVTVEEPSGDRVPHMPADDEETSEESADADGYSGHGFGCGGA